MTERRPFFAVLDPRKAKRQNVEDALRGLYPLSFRRLPPLWPFGGFAETCGRVEQAFEAARTVPQGIVKAWFKRLLLRLQYNGSRRYFTRYPDAVCVVWNGLNGSRAVYAAAAEDAGNKVLYFELCPFPGRVTVDPKGVNFASALPRSAQAYLDWCDVHAPDMDEIARVGDQIRQRRPARKPADTGQNFPAGKFIFIPLQTPGDSQLRLFGGAFPTIESFVAAICEAAEELPGGWHVRLKEHPTAEHPLDKTALSGAKRVFLCNEMDTFEQVRASSLVVTVNSSVGLEAMFFDKPVSACGQCFWAIDGIAHSATDPGALRDLFTAPETVRSDQRLRQAFLSYLVHEYYPRPDGSGRTQAQILKRLEKAGQLTAITGKL